MIAWLKRIFFLLLIFCLPVQIVISQNKTSKNNNTGNWTTPSTWVPDWTSPQTEITGYNITINGFVECKTDLIFSGIYGSIVINDTLVVEGNLILGNNNNLTVGDNGILIVRGNLIIDNQTDISANGYLIVTGNVIKYGSQHHGSFTSNDNPVKVFIGGSSNIGNSESRYPVVNCPPAHSTTGYSNSDCTYGNMTDILNDPINSFFQSTFIAVTSAATPGTVCAGAQVQLNATAKGGSGNYTYTWTSVPAGFTSNVADPKAFPSVNTTYNVSVYDGFATVTSHVAVKINAIPATPAINTDGPSTLCDGGSVTLSSGQGTSYLWSTGAKTASINVTVSGSYKVQITDAHGCLSAESAVKVITVNALPATPVISESGSLTFCSGGSVTLTSGAGSSYLWSTGAATQSVIINRSGSYTVKITNSNGCLSAVSLAKVVTVTEMPVAFAGPDQELQYRFETELNAEIPTFGTGEWSLISGSGLISDIYSPVTPIIKLSAGETIFLWKVINGICEASDEILITVYDLFIPSVITPDGDGKNDCFRISEMTGPVDLTIFNKSGNIEYTNSNYLNNWDGRNNKGIELPGDTYFYILKFDDFKVKKGSVLIKR
jgi:gliding motility-associated-like protein